MSLPPDTPSRTTPQFGPPPDPDRTGVHVPSAAPIEGTQAQTPDQAHASADRSSGPPGVRVGEYELGPLLGKGGMGEVYRGRHARLNRAAAVKLVRGPADDRERARFLVEAEAVAAIKHPPAVTGGVAGTTLEESSPGERG